MWVPMQLWRPLWWHQWCLLWKLFGGADGPWLPKSWVWLITFTFWSQSRFDWKLIYIARLSYVLKQQPLVYVKCPSNYKTLRESTMWKKQYGPEKACWFGDFKLYIYICRGLSICPLFTLLVHFTYILMPHKMIVFYFRLPYCHVSNRALSLHRFITMTS